MALLIDAMADPAVLESVVAGSLVGGVAPLVGGVGVGVAGALVANAVVAGSVADAGAVVEPPAAAMVVGAAGAEVVAAVLVEPQAPSARSNAPLAAIGINRERDTPRR